jgi:hypothetical protein
MSMKSFISAAAMAAVTGLGASIASAATVDINGGTSWGGWNAVGNAQTSGVWVLGNTNRTFDIYRSSFVLSSSQSVGGTRLSDGAAGNGSSYTGDTASSLFSGSWQAGDRIIGIGIGYTGTSRGNTFFFHTDGGVRNILPASSFGAGDGVLNFDVGDTSSYVLSGYANSTRGRVRQYSIFNGRPELCGHGLGFDLIRGEHPVLHQRRCGSAPERWPGIWRRRPPGRKHGFRLL